MIRATAMRLALAGTVVGIVVAGLPASAPATVLDHSCRIRLVNEARVTFSMTTWEVGWGTLGHAEGGRPNDIADWPWRETISPSDWLGRYFNDQGDLFSAGCAETLMWRADLSGGKFYAVQCHANFKYVWSYADCVSYGNYDVRQGKLEVDVERALTATSTGLSATVRVTSPGAPAPVGSPPSPPAPKLAASPLRRGDLRGSGWRNPTASESGRLIGSLKPSKRARGCASTANASDPPSSMAKWLFVRNHDGQQVIGGTSFRFARAAQARRAQAALLSPRIARCVALSIGTHKGITASDQRLPFVKLGDGSAAYRIVVHSSAPKGSAYLDLVSLRKGRGTALIVFYAEGHQPASEIEQAAAGTVARRMKR